MGGGARGGQARVQAQPPLSTYADPQWAQQLVEQVAEGMPAPRSTAVDNSYCRKCPVRSSCPLHEDGGRSAHDLAGGAGAAVATPPPTPEQELRDHGAPAAVRHRGGAGSARRRPWASRRLAGGQRAVEPHRVLGLTFTRKAAGELSVRVRRMLRRMAVAHDRDQFLAPEVAALLASGEPTVSTYHGYAAALVAEHALRAGIEPSARLLGEAMTWQYAAEVVQAYDGPMANVEHKPTTVIADVLGLAGELAEHLATADDVRALSGRLRDLLDPLPRAAGQRGKDLPLVVGELRQTLAGRLQLLPLVDRYVQLKRRRDAMDYGDQVALAARIARDDPAVGEIERSRFSAVLLDEYQDTGESQRVLLRSLYGDGHAVTAVGDPRQAIYGWRGASAGNLERFPTDFPRSDGTAASSTGLTVSFRTANASCWRPTHWRTASPFARSTRGRCERLPTGRIPARSCVPCTRPSTTRPPGWRRRSPIEVATGCRGRRWRSWFGGARSSRRSKLPCARKACHARWSASAAYSSSPTSPTSLPPCVSWSMRRPATRPCACWLARGGGSGRAISTRWAGGLGGWRCPRPSWIALRGRRSEPDAVDERSLIDALDDLGSGPYSPEGYRRLVDLRDELRRLRRACVQPLPIWLPTSPGR